jgi:hypothetical protein
VSAIWDEIESAIKFTETANFQTVLKDVSTVNWTDIIAAISTQKLILNEDEQTLDKILQIIGVFFPPATLAANDISALYAVVQILVAINNSISNEKPHWAVLPGPPLWVR